MKLRAPSVPLIAIDPNFSIWSPANSLTDTNTVHWTNKEMVMMGHITVDGVKYRPMQIDVLDDNNLRVVVTEGKKNEVRIVLRACHAPVRHLRRISFGPITLGNLAPGQIRQVPQKTIDEMLKSL